jgi:predicted ribonuclease YlaK
MITLPEKFRDRNIYILDTSAIMTDSKLDLYVENHTLIRPAVFLLTTPVLKEIDDKKPKAAANFKNNFANFITSILKWQGLNKLSEGVLANTFDGLYLSTHDESVLDLELNKWIGSHADHFILATAQKLAQQGERVGVLSDDAMLTVLCREFDVTHHRISIPTPSVSTVSTSNGSGDLTLVSN